MRGTTVCARSHSIRNHLQGKKKTPITWCAQACQDPHLPGHIYGYADASFADVKPEKTLSMGYVFLINNAAVSWWATCSPIVLLNACEAEVVSLSILRLISVSHRIMLADIFVSPRPQAYFIPFSNSIPGYTSPICKMPSKGIAEGKKYDDTSVKTHNTPAYSHQYKYILTVHVHKRIMHKY